MSIISVMIDMSNISNIPNICDIRDMIVIQLRHMSQQDFVINNRCNSMIPIHNILGKFIKCKFNVRKKKPKEYMAVIPLNKKISF